MKWYVYVSIHSGHCWPENQRNGNIEPRGRKFQSTPAIAGRRIAPPVDWSTGSSQFQSTPAIAGRRIKLRSLSVYRWVSFNPLRPLLAGESVTWPLASRPVLFQSTPAIAGRRISCGASGNHRMVCFNPLRPLLAGESSAQFRGWIRRCSFNPLRPLLAGESSSRRQTRSSPCFNPLRPLLAGESTINGATLTLNLVSIHSGHCWPENRASGMAAPRAAIVSIHSGHCWPENLVTGVSVSVQYVSIHSGHCWPENRRTASRTRHVSVVFQSTPAIAGRRIALQRTQRCS